MDPTTPIRPRTPRTLHAVVARRQAKAAGAEAPAVAPEPAIERLQRRLNRLDYRDADGRALPVDGVFGERTEEALLDFQRAHGLRVDGVAGPRTLAALYPADDAAPACDEGVPIRAGQPG